MRGSGATAVLYFISRHKLQYGTILLLTVVSTLLESFSVAAFFPLFTTLLGNNQDETGGVLGLVTSIVGLLPFFAPIVAACVMIIGIFLLKNVLLLGRDLLMAYSTGKLLYDLKKQILERYAGAHYQFFLDSRQGTLLNDNLAVPPSVGAVLLAAMRMATSLLTIVFVGALLIDMIPLAALAVLALGVFYYVFIHYLSVRVSYLLGSGRVRSLNEQTVISSEFITGIRHIFAFNSARSWLQRFDLENRVYSDAVAREYAWQAIPRPLMELSALTLLVGLILVLWVTNSDEFAETVPAMGVFAVALMRLLPALISMGATRMAFMSNLPATEQTYRAITSPLPQRSDGNVALEAFERAIVFEHVSFAHKGRETLLQDMDLTFEKGQVTAIAGPSGAGKTTIINLILGLFQPTKGKITVDGIPLQDIKQETWLSKIGFVSQDPFTYHTTIAENILFGRNGHSMESVIQAAKIANAHGFISELPQGYDTVVGDRGMTLSGGQQQRLAIARAMLDSPEILIFDEATSSLDSLSETLVQEAIDSVSIDRTVIIIAHRFSTIEHADKIIVLDNGRVVEQGPHQELLSGQGLYAHMAGEV